MTISIKPTASGSTIEQDGSTILTVDGSGNITPSNQLYPKVPAFSATKDGSTNQTINTGTWTKITFDTEEFDNNTNYDTTNSIYTPTVSGYYHFTGAIYFLTSQATTHAAFYKNGAIFKRFSRDFADNDGSGQSQQSVGSALIYMNGSTDYMEVYAFQNGSGSTQDIGSNFTYTFFQAHLVSV